MQPVHLQRQVLCDLLDELSDAQWQAETMCDGWDAGDVCAHLLVREREPWSAAGIYIKPLAGVTGSRMEARKAKGRAAMVADLRDGPPLPLRLGPIGNVQVSEDYIHAEDIRRGGAAGADGATLTPDDGTRDPAIADLLWGAVGRFAPMTLGGVRGDGVLALTDGTQTKAFRVGGRFARPAGSTPPNDTVTVSGPVGDLLLFTTGRRGAQVTIDGRDDLVAAVEGSRRGV